MPQIITIPAIEEETIYRIISQINYFPGSHLTVITANADLVNGVLVARPPANLMDPSIVIAGDAYAELLSDKPAWNTDKAADYYNEDDLWYVIGEIEAGNITSLLPVLAGEPL